MRACPILFHKPLLHTPNISSLTMRPYCLSQQASCSVTMLVLSSGARAFNFVPPPATGSAPLFPFASSAGRHQHHHYQHHEQHRRCFRHRSSTRARPDGGSVVVGAAARRRRTAGVGVLRCSEGAVASTPEEQVSYTIVGCAALLKLCFSLGPPPSVFRTLMVCFQRGSELSEVAQEWRKGFRSGE